MSVLNRRELASALFVGGLEAELDQLRRPQASEELRGPCPLDLRSNPRYPAQHVGHRLGPILGLFLQHREQERVELGRNPARIGTARGRGRRLVDGPFEHRLDVAGGEEDLPGEHLVEHRSERVNVRPLVGRLAAQDLGADGARRTEHRGRHRALQLDAFGFTRCTHDRPGEFGDAEIEQLDREALRMAGISDEEDVVRLHVAMHDAHAVRRSERAARLFEDREGIEDMWQPTFFELAPQVELEAVGVSGAAAGTFHHRRGPQGSVRVRGRG